mmetsp:Transcript_16629/g.31623  ORF Transcript_16629/g.31623 Transcript_16629/m.31623 type:complete len:345 (-) Transcript_16629:122-1156(-)
MVAVFADRTTMRRSLFFSLFFVLRQGQSFVPSTRPWFAIDAPAPASRFRHDQVLRSNGASSSSRTDDMEITDEKLYEIARRLKLEIFDLEEGIFGFDSQDPVYGLEVIQTEIPLSSENPSLGLVLTEMAGNKDGRGLVLVSEVTGNAKNARSSPILVGDVITGVRTSDGSLRERTTGLNYDRTVEAVGDVKEAALKGDGTLHLELNRLVKRATIQVQVVQPGKNVTTIEALAGENLRRLLLRKDIRLYNRKTKRFDMPYATGDCAGEGLCGTCLVAVNEGMDLLNPKDGAEELITRGRPLSWRASCRTVVGSNNEGGTIQVRVQPQSDFEDELNPRVKSVKRKE